MQPLIALLLVAIVASLAKAMFHMGSADGGGAMVRALTARILLSMALFALLFVSYHFGWMHPHGGG